MIRRSFFPIRSRIGSTFMWNLQWRAGCVSSKPGVRDQFASQPMDASACLAKPRPHLGEETASYAIGMASEPRVIVILGHSHFARDEAFRRARRSSIAMKSFATLAAFSAFIAQAAAHYTFPSLVVGGTTTPAWVNVRKTNNFNTQAPVTDVTSPDFTCYDTQTDPTAETITVAAGQQLGIMSDGTIYHPGVVNVYMAKAPSDVDSFDGSGTTWFKVYQISAVTDGGSTITFPAEASLESPSPFPRPCRVASTLFAWRRLPCTWPRPSVVLSSTFPAARSTSLAAAAAPLARSWLFQESTPATSPAFLSTSTTPSPPTTLSPALLSGLGEWSRLRCLV
ncbi:hypothetical protein EVG20_g6629 [Dentipellis fragilis]|uniref:AA9 family lytic polysaccharide monooxygenase n=1 Tax=Dentipellis fragilis TaxID=205917 RepID=A0A4Y9YL12_9AGAM|nr:hypothetical protein EVG20_g6629 [Dentipellis fragilis]